MAKIKRNFKVSYIALGIIDGLLVLTALTLLFFLLIYHGSLAPKLFSHRIYIMDTEAFSLVKKGSALIADQVNFDQILPGNIVIFTDEKEKTTVGEVQKSEFENNVYTFTVKNDAGILLTVGQSHILGKGMYYSEFLGGIISFAVSPAGVCCAAVLPCAAFFVWEVIAAVKRKSPQPTVATVKKQYETPTYIPPQQKKDNRPSAEEQIPFEERPAFDDSRQRLVEAAGLYAPAKKSEPVKAEPEPVRPAVNEREIDKLIQQAKARRLNEEASNPTGRKSPSANSAPSKKTYATPINVAKSAYSRVQNASDSISQKNHEQEQLKPMDLNIDDKPLKRINEEPLNEKPEPKHSHSRSSPRLSRLDSLLHEESSNNSQYDINNILRNMKKK